MDTILLTTCTNSIDANILKGMLESNDIECFLANENFTGLMPNYYGIMGSGVMIYINKTDEEKAKNLLSSQNHEDLVVCPHCGSTNITFGFGQNKFRKIMAIVCSILVWVPFGNVKASNFCNDCKNEFPTH